MDGERHEPGAMAAARDVLVAALTRLAVAAILVEADGGIVAANPAGDALLERRDGLAELHGRLFAAHLSTHARLAPLVQRLARRADPGAIGGALRLPRLSGRPALEVLLVACAAGEPPTPRGGRCLLLVRDPERPEVDFAAALASLPDSCRALVGAT